jgi:hypothetical protein
LRVTAFVFPFGLHPAGAGAVIGAIGAAIMALIDHHRCPGDLCATAITKKCLPVIEHDDLLSFGEQATGTYALPVQHSDSRANMWRNQVPVTFLLINMDGYFTSSPEHAA